MPLLPSAFVFFLGFPWVLDLGFLSCRRGDIGSVGVGARLFTPHFEQPCLAPQYQQFPPASALRLLSVTSSSSNPSTIMALSISGRIVSLSSPDLPSAAALHRQHVPVVLRFTCAVSTSITCMHSSCGHLLLGQSAGQFGSFSTRT